MKIIWLELWIELMIIQTVVGYCFVIANALIGLNNIRDLNLMKGDIVTVKYHKWYGRTEIFIFYALFAQCIYMFYAHLQMNDPLLFQISAIWAHSWIGGFFATVLVTTKLIYAKFKKDEIYKYGQFLGPIGLLGWSISHWTSLYNYYFFAKPIFENPANIAPALFIYAALIPFLVGPALFLITLYKKGGMGKNKERFGFDQIAFILHGITFGYEKSAKELMGTPALFKYVVPQTYQFIEKMMKMSGYDIDELEKLNVADAMKEFVKMAEKIGMAEKIKIAWETEDTFTIESVNCSTSRVRSVMTPEELTNAVCPWAIFAASIVNKITGKELEFQPSTFNEIGAKTQLKIVDKK